MADSDNEPKFSPVPGPNAPPPEEIDKSVDRTVAIVDKRDRERHPGLPRSIRGSAEKAVLLDEAWFRIVKEGAGIAQVALELNVPYPWLAKKALEGRWAEARVEEERRKTSEAATEEVLDKAISMREEALLYLKKARDRLSMMEHVLSRKWTKAVADTTVVSFTDAAGTAHSERVAVASTGELSSLLDLQKRILEQVDLVAKMSEARTTKDLRRHRGTKAALGASRLH